MARKLSPDPDHVHCEHVALLEQDVRDLKRRLANRDPLAGIAGHVKRTSAADDPFAHLPDQDRRYLERKMGKGGKS